MNYGVIFQLDRPGVAGASRLARKLNVLKNSGNIHDWHPGRWKDGKAQTRLEIVFDSEIDANLAQATM